MKSALCPSCGAPVSFKSAASLYAVCGYCKSTLLRQGEALSNLGKMAELQDDPTLLQIGSEGHFKGIHFGVIGRIQLKYQAGLWNEWHILFDDGNNAWLSEAGGEYVLSRLAAVKEPIPAFASLEPDSPVNLGNKLFLVSDLETARCIAGEGELPFKVDAGYDVETADLRLGDDFATIDYSETPPLVFLGKPVSFDELKLSNLRQPRDLMAGGKPTAKAKAFNCPHCGAPFELHSGIIETVACTSCGSVLDVADENVQLIKAASEALQQPRIPLGSKGKLDGVDWEIIGYLRRSTSFEGSSFTWAEYLLFNDKAGFAWLTEDQGHWNFARPMSKRPPASRKQTSFKFDGRGFQLFNRGRAEVTYVLGEFYWKVRVGENVATADYVCAPTMLSREISAKEVSWSRAEYLEPDSVWAAFQVKAPQPRRVGIYGNQPNYRIASHKKVCALFWTLFLLASAVQFWFVGRTGSLSVMKQDLTYTAGQEETVTSAPFQLTAPGRTLYLRHATNLDNNWLSLNTLLVEKDSGATYQATEEISYYHGVDDGESWSEGNSTDEVVFRDIPAGNYYLAVDYELGKDKPDNVSDSIEMIQDPSNWSNYLLLVVFLMIFPLVSRWRRNQFETERWEESGIGNDDDKPNDGQGGAGGDDSGSSVLANLAGAAVVGVIELLTS